MFYTDDPIRDFERYDAEQERKLQMLPKCHECGEHIQQERAVHYNGKWCCKECEYDFWHSIREEFLENTSE